MNKSRARFNLVVDADRMVIEIVDMLGIKSVTNEIEAVIEDIAAIGIAVDDYAIVYRDTMCVWDGVRTKDGRFDDFFLRHTAGGDREGAILAVQQARRH